GAGRCRFQSHGHGLRHPSSSRIQHSGTDVLHAVIRAHDLLAGPWTSTSSRPRGTAHPPWRPRPAGRMVGASRMTPRTRRTVAAGLVLGFAVNILVGLSPFPPSTPAAAASCSANADAPVIAAPSWGQQRMGPE